MVNSSTAKFFGGDWFPVKETSRQRYYFEICFLTNHIDFLVELPHGAFSRVQVKTVFKSRFPTSLEVRTERHTDSERVDVIAIYYVPKDLIAFVPYNNEKHFVLAISHSKNNQLKTRNWIYQYSEFPDFISRGK